MIVKHDLCIFVKTKNRMKPLSLKSYGLLLYLQRNGITRFNYSDITDVFKDGIVGVTSAVHELRDSGIVSEKMERENGRISKRHWALNDLTTTPHN